LHVSRLPTTLHRCCDCHRLLQKAVKEAEASLAATERQLSEAAGKLAASEKEVAALQAAVQVGGSRRG
jgi:Tfp pilus assembly protein FimV